DPEGFRDMRALLRELVQQRGMTVLLSSHLLHEVEQVATRVGVIRGGKMLVEASVDELRNRAARRIEVAVSDPPRAARLLRDRFGWPVSALEDGTLLVHGAADPSRIAQAVVGESIRLRRLVEREPSLEDVFFALSEGGPR
ncbi:MAG: bacitracin ABC transporter ATP-binding protein, partial [Clostridia bacterium]|nr:bacitracin ABC transporter ATP-binding protein [Clostridia bacterium]